VYYEKKYFYEYNGNVFLEANDQTEAEKLVTGASLENYLIDEELYEIDENYVTYDLKKQKEQLKLIFTLKMTQMNIRNSK
jgi:hypothetical protein